jgi:hypothetical protein
VRFKRPDGTRNGKVPAVGPPSINGTLAACYKPKDRK